MTHWHAFAGFHRPSISKVRSGRNPYDLNFSLWHSSPKHDTIVHAPFFPQRLFTNPPALGNGLGTGTRHGLQLFQFRAGLATGRCSALAHQCVAPRSGGSTWDTTKSYSLLAYATRKCTLAAIFVGFFLGSWVGVFYWYVASCSSCYVWCCVDMFCVIFMSVKSLLNSGFTLGLKSVLSFSCSCMISSGHCFMAPGAAEQPVLVVISSGCLVALGVFDANLGDGSFYVDGSDVPGRSTGLSYRVSTLAAAEKQ